MQRDTTPVSDEQMQAAYERVRKPGWPSLAELTQAARRFQLVRAAVNSRTCAAPSPVVHTSAQPAIKRHQIPHHPPTFDAKSAAAGERPDDE